MSCFSPDTVLLQCLVLTCLYYAAKIRVGEEKEMRPIHYLLVSAQILFIKQKILVLNIQVSKDSRYKCLFIHSKDFNKYYLCTRNHFTCWECGVQKSFLEGDS